MSKEEISKKMNPYDLNSVKRERTTNFVRKEPRDINPYSLNDRNSIRSIQLKRSR
jgi:hypothetical protein